MYFHFTMTDPALAACIINYLGLKNVWSHVVGAATVLIDLLLFKKHILSYCKNDHDFQNYLMFYLI